MRQDLADVIGVQHGELLALLDDLERQPAITDHTVQGQLRARSTAMRTLERAFVAQHAARRRILWPVLRQLSTAGRAHVERDREQARSVEHRMAKRQWYGDRDETLNSLDADIAWGVRKHVVLERRELARLAATGELAAEVADEMAGELEDRGPWPTRPHPDLPQWPPLAVLVSRPLAFTDRVIDRCAAVGAGR
jgi:hypothetical protein